MKNIDGVTQYKRGSFGEYFELYIQPRVTELNELMAQRSGKTTKIKVTFLTSVNDITVQELDEDGDLLECNHNGYETEKQEGSYMNGDELIEFSTDNDVYYCDKCNKSSVDLKEWS